MCLSQEAQTGGRSFLSMHVVAVESAEPTSEDQRVGPMKALGCLFKVFHNPHQEQISLEQFSVASKK